MLPKGLCIPFLNIPWAAPYETTDSIYEYCITAFINFASFQTASYSVYTKPDRFSTLSAVIAIHGTSCFSSSGAVPFR